MGRFHCPLFFFFFFFFKAIYADFKAQRNAFYHCHGNGILEEIGENYDGYTLAKLRLDKITPTISKSRR